MSETSTRVGRWNRRVLAVGWALFGCACLGLLGLPVWWRSGTWWIPMLVGGLFLITSWRFGCGDRWARVLLAVLVALIALFAFDRLLLFHFRRYHGPYFWGLCVLLGVAFYTWLFVFSGLDRAGRSEDAETTDEQVG